MKELEEPFGKGAPAMGYWSKCRRKVRHQSMEQAYHAKSRMREGDELDAYWCEECYGFHLGHRMKRAMERRKRV